jgi:hypothetical protein
MHHWGCPLWAVAVEFVPSDYCPDDCGRPSDVDRPVDHLTGRCAGRYGGHHDDHSCGRLTSRDVVINDVTLMSLKSPEWSQLVFCDDFLLVTMVVSHLFISDEIGFSIIDVSPICDKICVVMDLNSFYDKRFWS